jgi:hypothetical protein
MSDGRGQDRGGDFTGRVELDFHPEGISLGVPSRLPSGRPIGSLRVSGSFTAWQDGPLMQKRGDQFILDLGKEAYDVPGNSGYPELTFLADERFWFGYDFLWDAPCLFHKRLVVLVPPEEVPRFHAEQGKYSHWRSEYESPEDLANTRQVGSPRLSLNLWRSYHPFLPSKVSHPRESDRLQQVNQFIKTVRPALILNLSDNSQDLRYNAPAGFYRSLWEKGGVKLLETSYERVYYQSDHPAFLRLLARAVTLIMENAGPYWTHCRLGVDRTGVFSAFLGLLAGLYTEEVLEDYLRSNRAGILEYRDARLLVYCLQRFLGASPEPGRDYGPVVWVKLQEYLPGGRTLKDFRQRMIAG